jgi:hypothetical protein
MLAMSGAFKRAAFVGALTVASFKSLMGMPMVDVMLAVVRQRTRSRMRMLFDFEWAVKVYRQAMRGSDRGDFVGLSRSSSASSQSAKFLHCSSDPPLASLAFTFTFTC